MPLSISITSTPNKTENHEIDSTFTTPSQNIMSPEYLPSEISMEDDIEYRPTFEDKIRLLLVFSFLAHLWGAYAIAVASSVVCHLCHIKCKCLSYRIISYYDRRLPKSRT